MAAVSSSANLRKSDSKRRVSCETLCSSNSSCILQKRKVLHPLASSVKIKSSGGTVRQRVLSAKILKFKTLQNELNDANYHIAQLLNENKLLKSLQKKQDSALAKYEGESADLPRVLESYQEEIRVLQARNKIFRKNIRELNEQIKVKDDEIMNLRDQNKHLTNLSKSKNLEEREKLAKKVEELIDTIKERDATISTLNRKIALETKNSKFKINGEVNKNKLLQREIIKMNKQLEQFKETKDPRERRTVSEDKKQSLVVKLNSFQEKKSSLLDDKKSNDGSTSSLNIDDTESTSSSINTQKHVQISDMNDIKKDVATSELQLKKVVNSWQKKKPDTENLDDPVKDYANDMIETAQFTNKLVNKHVIDYEKSVKETQSLLSTLRENDEISTKLSGLALAEKMGAFDYAEFLKDKNSNNVGFKQKNGSETADSEEGFSVSKAIRNRSDVDNECKEKLLAKLRAIDNGENIEYTNVKKSKQDLLKELFG